MIRLLGGPMDGWMVGPDALALQPGWPGDDTFGPGHYVRTGTSDVDAIPIARWEPVPEEEQTA